MANNVEKVIKIAKAEEGYLEKASNKDLDSKTANPGFKNYTKYGRDMHKIYPAVMDFPAPWCDCYVDWCFYKAYGIATAKSLLAGNFDDYTVASAQMYKNKNAWGTVPKVGAQIFFEDSSGHICHTGLVIKVSASTVYTTEGNTSSVAGVDSNGGCVRQKSYSRTYARIAGYGYPKYDSSSSTTEETSSSSSVASPTLKSGSSGAEVKKLQKNLNALKITDASGKSLDVDGKFGTRTTQALKKYQKKYGLEVDGCYGPKSYSKMKSLIK